MNCCKGGMCWVHKLSILLVVIGAINWGLVGFFSFDLVRWIAQDVGSELSMFSKVVYALVGLSGLMTLTMWKCCHKDGDKCGSCPAK